MSNRTESAGDANSSGNSNSEAPTSFHNIFAETLNPSSADTTPSPTPRPARSESRQTQTPATTSTTEPGNSQGEIRKPAVASSSDSTKSTAHTGPPTSSSSDQALAPKVKTKENPAKASLAKEIGVKQSGVKESDPKQANAKESSATRSVTTLPIGVDLRAGQTQIQAPGTTFSVVPATVNDRNIRQNAAAPAAPDTSLAGVDLTLPELAAVPAPALANNQSSFADTAFALRITPGGSAASQNPAPMTPGQTAVSKLASPDVASQALAVPSPSDATQAALSMGPIANTLASITAKSLSLNDGSRPHGLSGGSDMLGNQTPWAAPSFAAAANGASDGAPSAAPAAPASPLTPDPADATPQTVRTVHLQLAGEGDQVVDMRLVEHAGALSVNVRTSDGALARGLQDHLPELGARLADEHYATQAWIPAANQASPGGSSSGAHDQQNQGRGGRSSSQGDSPSSDSGRNQQQDQKQQQPQDLWNQMAASIRGSGPAPPSA